MEVIVFPKKGFESHGFFIRLIRFATVPILNILPPSFLQWIMRRSSRDASAVLSHVGFTHALEIVYTRYQRKLFARGFMQGIADFFWHHTTSQAKALRNRLKIVEHVVENEITKRISITGDRKRISILTVGGGSSRAIIHAISRIIKSYPESEFKITNIDKDAHGMELGKRIAKEHNIESVFRWILGDARNITNTVPNNSIDIVEMVGLLDYFSEEQSIEAIGKIYRALRPGGTFIVANVHPNREQRFLHNMGWPAMHYRTPKSIARILHIAGFTNEPRLMFEPLKIHMVAVVEK